MTAPLRTLDVNEDQNRQALYCRQDSSSIVPAASFDRPLSPGYDQRNSSVPSQVTEYVEEIIEHLLARERTLHRDPHYLSNQPDVTERMRIILVDWLVDVHLKFKLHPETFFLAVDYVDRYLMVTRGARATLQLVGVCAILIAAKHEEIWPPEVRECIYISANTYTRDEILNMERDIASTLQFRLCVPTPFPFMSRVLDSAEATEDTRHLAAYCLDIAALDYNCLQFLPSCIGYAAVLIANIVTENTRRQANSMGPMAMLDPLSEEVDTVWNNVHQHYSRVPARDLANVISCARSILTCAAAVNAPTSRYHAVKRKFSSDKFGEVATRYALPTDI